MALARASASSSDLAQSTSPSELRTVTYPRSSKFETQLSGDSVLDERCRRRPRTVDARENPGLVPRESDAASSSSEVTMTPDWSVMGSTAGGFFA